MHSSVGTGVPGPDDPDWWLQYGLDGLVGGLIGGLATGIAVAITLIVGQRQSELNTARAAAADLQAACLRSSVVTGLIPALDDLEQRLVVHTAAFKLSGLAERRWPKFSGEIANGNGRLVALVLDNTQEPAARMRGINAELRRLSQLVAIWVSEPKSLERKKSREAAENRIKAANADGAGDALFSAFSPRPPD